MLVYNTRLAKACSLDSQFLRFLVPPPRATTSAIGSVFRTWQFSWGHLSRLHLSTFQDVVFTDEEAENKFHSRFSHHETHFQGEADCFSEFEPHQWARTGLNWPLTSENLSQCFFLLGFNVTNYHQSFDVIATLLQLLKDFCDWMLLWLSQKPQIKLNEWNRFVINTNSECTNPCVTCAK